MIRKIYKKKEGEENLTEISKISINIKLNSLDDHHIGLKKLFNLTSI